MEGIIIAALSFNFIYISHRTQYMIGLINKGEYISKTLQKMGLKIRYIWCKKKKVKPMDSFFHHMHFL